MKRTERKESPAIEINSLLIAIILAAVVVAASGIAIKAFATEANSQRNAAEMEAEAYCAPEINSAPPTDKVAREEKEEPQEDFENEKIEAALVEQGYFRDDVPLSYDEQDYLHTACNESGTPYALALSVIQKETQFQNITGDDGASKGYMQIQKKWHLNRMERLGVTDLMDPYSNFRVGCDFLAELLNEYATEEALTAYNSGEPGHNDYSREVIEYYEKWKELVGDDVSGIKS